MEGKEVRFGIFNSALFATVTTDASCGAVNSMHDSFTPLGGLVPLFNIQLGEVVFGGVGAGLYGMLVFVILAVFLAGLMVGRTPEYLGKKIESYDVKVSALAVLILIFDILGFTAWAAVSQWGLAGLNNAGPHGFSEILYAFSSGTGNNGSAFAGLTANTPWYNTTLALAMLIGRFFFIVPVLALAGNLAKKKIVPESGGSFPVSGVTFVLLLVGTVLIVGVLTFFPALSLGPIVEHFLMVRFQRGLLERRSIHGRKDPFPVRARDPPAGRRRVVSEAEPAVPDEEPRHVRHRGGGVPDDRLALLPAGERAAGLRPPGGRSGSGSRCCSPTSPRPWPRAGARPRPTRCARPAPGRWRTGCGRTARWKPSRPNSCERRTSSIVTAGEIIPADGEVIEGVATVDESAITGESAPVIREAGGDRSAVTGGTRVLSDRIKVRDHREPGESFLDRMIGLVEGARAPEDAERDRPDHPAVGPDDHLPGRGHDPEALRALFRRLLLRHRAGGAAGLPDPHHHRRPALAPSGSPGSTGWSRRTSWP